MDKPGYLRHHTIGDVRRTSYRRQTCSETVSVTEVVGKKAEVYESLIQSTSCLCHHFTIGYVNRMDGYVYGPDGEQRAIERNRKASDLIESYVHTGDFLISSQSEALLQKIMFALRPDEESDLERYERVSTELLALAAELKREATEDLKGASGQG